MVCSVGGFNDTVGTEFEVTITNNGNVAGTLDYNLIISSVTL